jgi:MSHA biogenesis protein MshI
MAISIAPGVMHYAFSEPTGSAGNTLRRCGSYGLRDADAAYRASRELRLENFRCTTLLDPSEYQLLLVDAPKVPPTELKSAIRWSVKDLLDFHIDDATVDVLDVPPGPDVGNRAHLMFAVGTRNETIQATVDRYHGAHIPITIIDIQETAQRNISARYEEGERGVALLYLGETSGLLTISAGQELCFARRIDVGLGAGGPIEQETLDRLLLELQRTFDHFDRQFRHIALGKLVVGPEPRDSTIVSFLDSHLEILVEPVYLREVLEIDSGVELDRETEWRLFHLVGASLRQETKAV